MAFVAGASLVGRLCSGHAKTATQVTCCASSSTRKTILLVDHGSRRREANDMLSSVAAMLEERAREEKVELDGVVVAHMELAEPTIEDGLATCLERGAKRIDVVPYFLAPGRHSTSDIPRMVAEAMGRMKPESDAVEVTVRDPLGVHPKICDVVLERAELLDD
mmetsp:Transcript_14670/g.36334  ORF Transcript_14670/g.36334 Transcript_14670/m.36334 type:complete len:163 (+) Transcript_14670:92-580(+)